MWMPKPDQSVIDRRREIIGAGAIVPGEGLIIDEDELRAYDCDALTAYKQLPLIVVCRKRPIGSAMCLVLPPEGVKIVPRGAGTCLGRLFSNGRHQSPWDSESSIRSSTSISTMLRGRQPA